MSEAPFDANEWKKFDPQSQKQILQAIENAKKDKKIWYCKRGRECDGLPHDDIDYNHARSDQWPPTGSEWFTWLIKSGRGCVAPWTRVYNPETGEHVRVDQIDTETVVQTLRGPAPTDGAPFVKGEAHMWTVTTKRGDQVTVTDEHRFLTPEGWQTLGSLRAGHRVAVAPHAPRQTDSECQSASREDAQSSPGTLAGSRGDYQTCPHCDDPRLLSRAGIAEAHLPSRGDAGGRTLPSLREDAQASSEGCSHPYPRSTRQPRSSSFPDEPSVPVVRSHGSPSRVESSQGASRGLEQSRTLTSPSLGETGVDRRRIQRGSLGASDQPSGDHESPLGQTRGGGASGSNRKSQPFGPLHEHSGLHREGGMLQSDRLASEGLWVEVRDQRPSVVGQSSRQGFPTPETVASGSCPAGSDVPADLLPLVHSFSEIESIEYSHYGVYYDLTVPRGQHYTAEGMVHHNSGKTRSGAEWVRSITSRVGRIALIGRRGPDVRGTMIEGESGLINVCERAGMSYEWYPSRKEFVFGNGARAFGYSGEEPDTLRGPQHGAAWLDEPAHMPLIRDVWDNLVMGLRLEGLPGGAKVLCTSTPLPLKWLKELQGDDRTITVTVSTHRNLVNLDETFRRNVLDKYEGTRLGRQELYGEILEDVEGALWTHSIIEPYRNKRDDEDFIAPEDMDRIVVGVDPAGTSSQRRDETGIIVVGKRGDHFYVIDDYSGHYTPEGWARAAYQAYDKYNADAVIAEKNYGGEMVLSTLRNHRQDGNAKLVHSRRGKALRAEPVVGLYEQGRVHHFENLDELETQMTEWVVGDDSPDRVDGLVHAVTELSGKRGPSAMAVPTQNIGRDDSRRTTSMPFGRPVSGLVDHRGQPLRSW